MPNVDRLRDQRLHLRLSLTSNIALSTELRRAARKLAGERRAVHDVGDHHARAFARERLRIVPAIPAPPVTMATRPLSFAMRENPC